ncbi:ABC transporter permease [Pseudomonas sp. GX19020]|uniref:ABC transporter permease n=1 Tax=Pseudomonadota TaxID=1224 RepID=UPI00089A7F87|nr:MULTISPECIES: ABC transporter permease [Pseudomonadota]MCL4065982.1 ABC transporter permease [Pseudomonas sp. GX19020]SEC74269.1 microcin C transport system permease protein [Rhodobacter sp. 24-YEA-8]
MALSPLNQRRWRNFKANRRAYWSLILFGVLYLLTLGAELIANDRPLLVRYQGSWHTPFLSFYPETRFGGVLRTEATWRAPEVQCLIMTGGNAECENDTAAVMAELNEKGTVLGEPVQKGWILWAPIPYRYSTIVDTGGRAPAAPSARNLLGTDEASRDVLARVIYGFRLSVTFALIVTVLNGVFGVAAGAVQGYFGGKTDLIFQRVIELWGSIPSIYVIIILTAIWAKSFWLMVFLLVLFGWTGLVGVVRAEFLRARNFEYVRAARALGVPDLQIMFRHMLPNAMVATLTMLPFMVTGTIGTLAMLDYLGFGLPLSAPSLGQLSRQAQANLQSPHLAFVAFFTFAIMLTLLIFIFEGIRDAFDPRKTFR